MKSSDALLDKVHGWLDKQGYPLEMRVAAALRSKADLQVRQGWHYADPETNQSREIDIVTTKSEFYGFAAVHFSFECKGTTKPWVIFTSEHTTQNYDRLRAFGLTSSVAREVLVPALVPLAKEKVSSEVVAACKQLPWLWDKTAVGYALVQAFDGNNDVPYAAMTSAVKAALHWFVDSPEHNSPPSIMVSFPAVVTSSPLFECCLDKEGQTQLREINRGFLFYQRRIGEMLPVKVAVVSEKGLDAYIGDCMLATGILMNVFSPKVQEMWEELKNR
jgi:hypothetical protein